MTPLLRDAAQWRMISLLFECPREGWHEQVRALAREVDDPQLKEASEQALAEADEGLYHSLFAPGGPAPPREATYKDSLQLGHLLSELNAFYSAFAYTPRTSEPADHVSVEAGFLAYLRLKQAYALANGDEEHAETTAQAATDFLREHLSRIADPLAKSLAHSGIPYLSTTAAALRQRTGPSIVVKTEFPILPDEEAGCSFEE
ncbi:MAG: molecular chaperone TorD family protein [Acidimicrobiia bacterium]|nr:molecular chaperone TorD family protein [Acidimicrobiia bacterium]